jgi:restriction system protein
MIPDFQSIMLPFLEILADKKEHTLKNIIAVLTLKFKLTDEEKQRLIPSQNQTVIINRIGWTRTYLKKAELIISPKRGVFTISPLGLDILSNKPTKIDSKFLRKIPAFQEWKNIGNNSDAKKDDTNLKALVEDIEIEKTPEELLEYSFSRMQEQLVIDLLDQIKTCTPAFFEWLVIDLLIKMGYGGSKKEAGKVIGKSNDGGIDGVIKEDKLGLDTIYIQAKKWENVVPVSQVRDFAGALLSKKAKKGIFIATSSFPKSAYEFVGSIEPRIILIDGKQLAEFMIEHNVGISTKVVYEIKKIDSDYFSESE